MPNLIHPHIGVKRLIASSAAFQSAAGVASADAALAFITSTVCSLDFNLVRAQVRMADGLNRKNTGLGNWKTSGAVRIVFERWYSPAYEVTVGNQSLIDARSDAMAQWVSDVVSEMETLLDARQAIMDENPIALESFQFDGEALPLSGEYGPKFDGNDSSIASYKRTGEIWFMAATAELY